MNFIHHVEDEMITIHGESGFVATLHASCPEQANDFERLFKNQKQTLQKWKKELKLFKENWQSFEEE